MPDYRISVGLDVDTADYEQGLARADDLLQQLSRSMTRSAESMTRTCAQLTRSWSAINSSILLAISRARTLQGISLPPADEGAGQANALPWTAANAAGNEPLEQLLTRAVSGLSIQLDGQTVGRLVAPEVNAWIGDMARERRYTAG